MSKRRKKLTKYELKVLDVCVWSKYKCIFLQGWLVTFFGALPILGSKVNSGNQFVISSFKLLSNGEIEQGEQLQTNVEQNLTKHELK